MTSWRKGSTTAELVSVERSTWTIRKLKTGYIVRENGVPLHLFRKLRVAKVYAEQVIAVERSVEAEAR